jgi:hypothetical protein
MKNFVIYKKNYGYYFEMAATSTFDFEKGKFFHSKTLHKAAKRKLEKELKALSEGESEVELNELRGVYILKAEETFMDCNLRYVAVYKLFIIDNLGLDYVLDEDLDLEPMRLLGKKVAKMLKVPMRTTLIGERLGKAALVGAIPSEYLGLPFAALLVKSGFYAPEMDSEELAYIGKLRNIEVKQLFLENTRTYFINYKQPLIYTQKESLTFLLLVIFLMIHFTFVFLMIWGGLPGFWYFNARQIFMFSQPPLLILSTFLAIAISYFMLFERVEIKLDHEAITYRSKSILGKDEKLIPIKEFEEFVTMEQGGLGGLILKRESLNFVCDSEVFTIHIRRTMSEALKNILYEALMRIGEKLEIDTKEPQ